MNYSPDKRYYYNDSEYINYTVIGSGDTTLVMLHGFGASLQNWRDISSSLIKEGIKLLMVDLKGSGFSSKPNESNYSMVEHARIVQSLIEELALKKYFILGHSFGGGVALLSTIQSLKSENSSVPKGIILLDAAVYKTELPFFVNYVRIPIIGNLILNLLSADYQAKYTLNKIFFDKQKVTPELINRYSFFIQMDGYSDALIQTADQIIPNNFNEYTDFYKNINLKTLIIWGKQDPALPPSSGEKLSKEIKNSKFIIIDKCGHNPQEEQPIIVADYIIKFIKEIEE